MKRKLASPYDVVVGVSVNPEIELKVENTVGPKKVLQGMSCCLSGSSGNVAMAIKKLGGPLNVLGGNRPHLLGLVGTNYQSQEKIEDILLRNAAAKNEVLFTPIEVLNETNHAVIPVIGETNGEVWGKKGDLVHPVVPQALKDITEPEIGIGPRTFVVITGLRAVEVPFAKVLLAQAQPGLRVLNAKDTLCKNREFRKILPLVDLLVLNQHEFEQTGMTISELHACGPKVIIKTCDKKGGWVYFWYLDPFGFSAVTYPGGTYETGAGDWFLGALISELIRLQKNVLNIKPFDFMGAIEFAAKVAGKKITIPGGGNGPSRHQLR